MQSNSFNSKPKESNMSNEKPYRCSGCGTPLGKYEEKCSKCERINPNYILK